LQHASNEDYKAQHAFLENKIGRIDLAQIHKDLRKSIERNTDFDKDDLGFQL